MFVLDSDHVGYDVAFYNDQAGGCCDFGYADGEYGVWLWFRVGSFGVGARERER